MRRVIDNKHSNRHQSTTYRVASGRLHTRTPPRDRFVDSTWVECLFANTHESQGESLVHANPHGSVSLLMSCDDPPCPVVPPPPLPADSVSPIDQGLTLVHFSAQLKRILWDRGALRGCLGDV